MKWLLLGNGILEVVVGILFLLWPGLVDLIPELDASAGTSLLLKMYGVSALSLGIYSFILYARRTNLVLVIPGLALFIVFHLGLGMVLLMESHDWRIGVLHMLLGMAFGVSYLQRSR